MSVSGGFYPVRPGGTTTAGGKFRVCGLQRGSYWLWAALPGLFGDARIELSDEDKSDLRVSLLQGRAVEAEARFAEPPAEDAPKLTALLFFEPLGRLPPPGDKFVLQPSIPGKVEFQSVMNDEYGVRVAMGNPGPGIYVRDVTFGGRSVLHGRVSPAAQANGEGLKLIVGRDGAVAGVLVLDKDGKPIPDTNVILFPDVSGDYALLADVLVTGRTDLQGRFRTGSLAPGKYFVAAADETFDTRPESIDRLWRSRNRFTEIELNPRQEKQLTLHHPSMSQ